MFVVVSDLPGSVVENGSVKVSRLVEIFYPAQRYYTYRIQTETTNTETLQVSYEVSPWQKPVMLSSDQITEALAIGDTGANGGWLGGKTLFDKVPIHFTTPHVTDGSRFDPLIAGKNTDGNVWAFGQGAGREICFVGYHADRTANGTDWKVSINTYNGTLHAPSISTSKGAVALEAYPVGAIYLSYVNTSPASLFGGEWVQLTGRFIRMANDVNTGGADSHVLTWEQMPVHSHTFTGTAESHSHSFGNLYLNDNSYTKSGAHTTWWNTKRSDTVLAPGSTTLTPKGSIGNAGSGQAHNNMPAYQNVYAWRRTA